MIGEMVGSLISEVFEALFIVIGDSFRGRKRRNKKSAVKLSARPTLNGVPPDASEYELTNSEHSTKHGNPT